MRYKETDVGFEWGTVKIERLYSNDKRMCLVIGLQTPKYKREDSKEIEIYVTKTGKVRMASADGEWFPERKKK